MGEMHKQDEMKGLKSKISRKCGGKKKRERRKKEGEKVEGKRGKK